jgi:hypothetical protein
MTKIKDKIRQMGTVMLGWACSHCGTWNSDSAGSCQGCGK